MNAVFESLLYVVCEGAKCGNKCVEIYIHTYVVYTNLTFTINLRQLQKIKILIILTKFAFTLFPPLMMVISATACTVL